MITAFTRNDLSRMDDLICSSADLDILSHDLWLEFGVTPEEAHDLVSKALCSIHPENSPESFRPHNGKDSDFSSERAA